MDTLNVEDTVLGLIKMPALVYSEACPDRFFSDHFSLPFILFVKYSYSYSVRICQDILLSNA